MARIAVTGSIAYDTIMVFPGHFGEHILPERVHMLNVSFLVNSLDRRRGGNAGNIAYTLALLGERPRLCAAVGDDFADYAAALRAVGVDTATALACTDVPCASCFITTDLDDNQITAFYPGAMVRAVQLDLAAVTPDAEFVVVAPDQPDAMVAHIEQALSVGARLVFAPAQQLPALDDASLRAGLKGAWLIVGNDYELEVIRSRTGMSATDLAARGAIVATTRGVQGSELRSPTAAPVAIPAAPATAVVDPTGAGDAYLAGLLCGLVRGRALDTAGRMGALAATYCVEHQGTQTHTFSREQFVQRYAQVFEGAVLGV